MLTSARTSSWGALVERLARRQSTDLGHRVAVVDELDREQRVAGRGLHRVDHLLEGQVVERCPLVIGTGRTSTSMTPLTTVAPSS